MKGTKLPVVFIYVSLGVLIWLVYPVSENWLPSFHPDDKIPYGTHILHKSMITQNHIYVEDISIDSMIGLATHKQANLFFINNHFEPSESEVAELLAFTKKGGKILLSTNAISYALADSLQIHWDYQTELMDSSQKICFTEKWTSKLGTLCYPAQAPNIASAFIAAEESYDDTDLNFSRDTLMQFNNNGHVTALQLFVGKGSWIVHSQPQAFTNFGLLHGHQQHVNGILSFYQDQPLVWDVHFIKRAFSAQSNVDYTGSVLAKEQKSPIVEILKHDLLRWAYWLLFSGVIVYFILMIKRKVRPIPVWKAPGNESVNFIRLIASVYLSSNDNKAILEKKIKMFVIHIHQIYGIRDFDWSEEAGEFLSSLSGYDPVKLKLLSNIALNYKKGNQVSFGYLSAANQLINEFVYASKLNS